MDYFAYEQLTLLFRNHQVDLAYLFGSRANQRDNELSDIDIALRFQPALSKDHYLSHELAISQALRHFFKTNHIDLMNLALVDDPLLRYNAVIMGKLLYADNQSSRFQLERQILQDYEDTRYLRRVQRQTLARHIKLGTYGRLPLQARKHL
jgi:predicted nucleotidyltransferase